MLPNFPFLSGSPIGLGPAVITSFDLGSLLVDLSPKALAVWGSEVG